MKSLIGVESGSYQVRILSPRLSLSLSLFPHGWAGLILAVALGNSDSYSVSRTFDRFAKRYAIN